MMKLVVFSQIFDPVLCLFLKAYWPRDITNLEKIQNVLVQYFSAGIEGFLFYFIFFPFISFFNGVKIIFRYKEGYRKLPLMRLGLI